MDEMNIYEAMEGNESCADRKRSFGFNLADERIELIDILSEDDNDFLVASPFWDLFNDRFSDSFGDQTGFRLSGYRNFHETETIRQIEKSPENIVNKSRPSFLRKSLAWDNAFFSSAGVLDPDELSIINKGTRTTEDRMLPSNQDLCTRRIGLELIANDDDCRQDWFEIKPFENNKASVYKSKSSQESLKISQPLKKVQKSYKDKAIERSGTVAKSSPKPPKASSGRPLKNLTRSDNNDLSGKSNVKMESISGKTTVVEKKLSSQKSTNLNLIRLSSPKFSSTITPTASVTSISTSSPQSSESFLRRKTETRKSKLSSSLSKSQIWKNSERSKRVGYVNSSHSLSLSNHPTRPLPATNTDNCSSKFSSSLSSLGKKQRLNESKSDCDTKMTKGLSLYNDAKKATDFPGQTCSLGSPSVQNFKPSELRPPSPAFGFFDENTPLSSHEEIIRRKMSQKVLPDRRTLLDENSDFYFSSSNIKLLPGSSLSHGHTSANKNTASSSSIVGKKINKSKSPHCMYPSLLTDKEKFLETRSVSDCKNPKYKLRSNSILEEEKRKESVLKSKRCKENDPLDEETGKKKLHASVDQIGFISKYFEAIDLNQNKKKMQHGGNQVVCKTPIGLSKPHSLSRLSSVSNKRTPLTDHNFSQTIVLPMDPKKVKLVKMASPYTSENEKEIKISSSMYTT